MTIANAKPQLWQEAIERGLPKRYRWADLIRDVSNEFSSCLLYTSDAADE